MRMMEHIPATIILLLISILEFANGSKWVYNKKTKYSYYVKTGSPNMNFAKAEKQCVSIGGHLASVHNKEEHIYIETLANSYVAGSKRRRNWNDRLLIGLHRNETNNNIWQYTDESQVDYYNWAKFEPSNTRFKQFPGEDCVIIMGSDVIFKGYYAYQWNDIACMRQFRNHICKKKGRHEDSGNKFTKAWATTTTRISTSTDSIQVIVSTSIPTENTKDDWRYKIILLFATAFIIVINICLVIFFIRRRGRPETVRYKMWRCFPGNGVNIELNEGTSIYSEIPDDPAREQTHVNPIRPPNSEGGVKRLVNSSYITGANDVCSDVDLH